MEYREAVEAVEAAAITLVIERVVEDELTALRSIIASSPGKKTKRLGFEMAETSTWRPRGCPATNFSLLR
ncbi:hypothetical protein [Cryobacterium sp. Y57]|uniref:hypothetical protein n=1 Tax=Cryobacterium sp. Y57 TaxID=2048287 RepID=UPI0011B04AEB|nr:hypothetical protein [Cryobacterium sp. Y57]